MFSVRLTGVEGGALLRADASSIQLRIRRNDSPLRFAQSTVAVPESAGVIALNVTRGRWTEDGPLVGSVDTEVLSYMFIYLPEVSSFWIPWTCSASVIALVGVSFRSLWIT